MSFRVLRYLNATASNKEVISDFFEQYEARQKNICGLYHNIDFDD
jgi:uncharacterized lipoprotein YehR (DUF1307 family)